MTGESIVPFGVVAPVSGTLPYTQSTGLLEGSSPQIEAFPSFAKWWQEAEASWEANRGAKSKLSLLGRLDFHHELQAQFPIAPVRVVYTASGNTLAAAVATDPTAVIEHKLYWMASATLDEARYLCGVLNSPVFTAAVRPYQSTGAFGPRDFDKYVWLPPTPLFEPGCALHEEIVELAAEAEPIAMAAARDQSGFQAARGAVRSALAAAGIAHRLDAAVSKLLRL